MGALPRLLLVGGPDIDARLELMHCLSGAFNVSAVGSRSTLSARFAAEGFNYYPYHLSRRVNPFLDLLAVGQLARLFGRLKPQIVHTFDTKPGVWGCLAARVMGIPIIIGTLTGLGSLYASQGLKTRLVRTIYQTLQMLACRASDLTIFQNHDDAHQFIAEGVVTAKKSMVILGSGVSTDLYAPDQISTQEKTDLRQGLGLAPGEVVVTMISRVIRSKGVLEFMRAAQEVCPVYPHVRFLLVGPEDADSVDRLNPAELAELRRAVIWPGPRRDVPRIFAVSDMFVLPSVYREGIPRVLLEAASMGLPIVTTDSPGCNEVVEDNVNGLLVPALDPAGLADAIVRLVKQPELRRRFGLLSRQRAVERFDLSVIAAQLATTYQRLLLHKAVGAQAR
jgi:glycosyltransferase involved in cell wall biosynthesis